MQKKPGWRVSRSPACFTFFVATRGDQYPV
jgi:hypothetical protein